MINLMETFCPQLSNLLVNIVEHLQSLHEQLVNICGDQDQNKIRVNVVRTFARWPEILQINSSVAVSVGCAKKVNILAMK